MKRITIIPRPLALTAVCLCSFALVPLFGCIHHQIRLQTTAEEPSAEEPSAEEPSSDKPSSEVNAESLQLDQGKRADSAGTVSLNSTEGSEEKPSRLPRPQAEKSSIGLVAFASDEEKLPIETVVGGAWTVDDAVAMALACHPSILQAQANVRQAIGVRDQVGLCPNPTIGYTADQLGDGGTDMNGGFLAQDIVLGKKLIKNVHVLQHAVDVQQAEVEVQKQRVMTDVKILFVRVLAAQRKVELTREFCAVAKKGVELAQKRLDAKEGSRPELLQTEIQLNQLELSLKQAEASLDGRWRQLAAAVGSPSLERQVATGSLEDNVSRTLEWDSKLEGIRAASPELWVATERLNLARANLDRQQIQFVPNLNTELAYGYDAGTNGEFARVQLGLPIPIHNANQGNVAAARASCAASAANLDRLTNLLQLRFAETTRAFEMALASVESYETQILPRAKESMELSERAYTAGEFDFLQVLIARRTFFEANIEYVLALEELSVQQVILDGMLISGGFDEPASLQMDDGLRGQALSGN